MQTLNSTRIDTTLVGPVSQPGLFFGHIDFPQPGEADAYSFELGGWLVGVDAAVQRVEVRHGPQLVRTAEVNHSRPDVVEHLRHQEGIHPRVLENAARCGFVACISTIGLPEQFQLQAETVMTDGRRAPLGTITGCRKLLRPAADLKMQPVAANFIGRSGSTWLMHLLGAHPEIVMHLRYPVESIVALHTLLTVETLSRPSNPPTSEDLIRFREDRDHAVSLPLYCKQDDPGSQAWLRREYVERLAKFGLETVDAFFSDLALRQGKIEARCFVEKVPVIPGSSALFAELYPGLKDIFLVRDYRDVACSRLAFFRQYGTFEAVVADMKERLSELLQAWKQRKQQAHLLHYEKLIRHPQETLKALFDYIGVDSTPAVIGRVIEQASAQSPEMKKHVTAGSVEHSIGRWRNDLSAEQQAVCEESFGEALREFGYLE